ncbi:MAG TPA: hypothetical protein VFI32_00175 [Rhodanobacteraceae bacterium]|nr:hypothetical protein [Rhodanobacteraceae bacterium]
MSRGDDAADTGTTAGVAGFFVPRLTVQHGEAGLWSFTVKRGQS